AHCGRCGQACAAGAACVAGACASGPTGERVFMASGSFVVPAGVTQVSVVVVGAGGSFDYSVSTQGGQGGGGLCYRNDIPVTPGASVPVVVGVAPSGGGNGGDSSFNGTLIARGGRGTRVATGGAGGGGTGGTCFNGGAGGNASGYRNWGGGGGAAGYAGAGGRGGTGSSTMCLNDATAGSGGGGGGGGASGSTVGSADDIGGSGGGVGLRGLGPNGAAGAPNCNTSRTCYGYGYPGGGGSGGGAGTGRGGTRPECGGTGISGSGGTYGGGASIGRGGDGAVRIIWGPGRSFPSAAM
ncbi:MAG: hypothetical protein Q8S73_15350, partial [Deltaproteobacteria bacterium]|nr:hypothetical protein [Deltaproteobacteria bacterium]